MQEGSESGKARATGKVAEPQAEHLLRFERLLGDVSSMLIAAAPADVPGRIEEALRAVMEFFGVDRAGLGERAPNGRNLSVRVSYGRSGIPLRFPGNIPMADAVPW